MNARILANCEISRLVWIFRTKSCVHHLRTDTVQPRNLSSSVPDIADACIETGTDNITTQSEYNDAFSTPDFQSDIENDAPVNTSPAQKEHFKSPLKRGKKRINYDDKFFEIESKKLSYFEKSSQMKQDSDYQFLMSLPEERQLRLRMKLMDVLLQEQEDRNSSVMSTSNVSPLSFESTRSSHNSSHSNEFVTDKNSAAVYHSNFDPL